MADKVPKLAPGKLTLTPATQPLVDSVLAALPSPNTRRVYARAIVELINFAAGKPVTRMLLLKWRTSMLDKSSSTVNVRMSAARKLIEEARAGGLINPADAADMLRVEGLPRRGTRTGNWLTQDEARRLLSVPHRKSARGKRNYLVLCLLLGCALRRSEVAGLQVETIQRREGRWVLADLEGKGGRTRTVAVPPFVKEAIDLWMREAKISKGPLLRRLTGEAESVSAETIAKIVADAGSKIGVPQLGAHDLRRTCAKLCRKRGGDLEQIQMMLGHESIRTTELYLGSEQELENAVNDNLGL